MQFNTALTVVVACAACATPPMEEEPRLFGTVELSREAPQEVSVRVVDVLPTVPGQLDLAEFMTSWGFELLPGVSAPRGMDRVPIYRSTLASQVKVLVHGPHGALVGSGYMKRGEAVPIAVAREVPISVTLNESAYPQAFSVFIVRPEFHAPDPSLNSGSERHHFLQDAEAVASLVPDFEDGTFVASVHLAAGAYFAELWSERLVNGSREIFLHASQPIDPAALSPALVFE